VGSEVGCDGRKYCDRRTIRFVIRLKDRESMAWLCREFGISRKTVRGADRSVCQSVIGTDPAVLGPACDLMREAIRVLGFATRKIDASSVMRVMYYAAMRTLSNLMKA
jgi:hypothetical protein